VTGIAPKSWSTFMPLLQKVNLGQFTRNSVAQIAALLPFVFQQRTLLDRTLLNVLVYIEGSLV